MPDCFARRTSRPAQVRSWFGEPGVDGSRSVAIVWMESTMTQPGLVSWTAASTSSTRVVAMAATAPRSAPSRCPRRLICCSDSSPLA